MLRALEHIAAKIVRLEAEEHDTISFDANSFKALRARELKLAAGDGRGARPQHVPALQLCSNELARTSHVAPGFP